MSMSWIGFPPGRPLNKPRGLELYELLANVAANVDLVTLYAFSTFSPDDMRLVPFVLGAQQMTKRTTEEGTVGRSANSSGGPTRAEEPFTSTARNGRAGLILKC